MGTNTYTYDLIGNRLSATENGATTLYAANELNQYTALNPASTNPTPFTYDPDGNMTSDGTWSYSWDAENRLIEVQPLVTNLDSTLVQYMYDAQSRRIARREFSWMAFLHDDPTWRYVQGRAFLYDDWNLLEERKPAIVPRTPHHYIPQTNLYLTGSDGPVSATYVWGLDLSSTLQGAGGIGGLLQASRGDTNTFSFYDANGNTTAVTDDARTFLDIYAYDGFGNETDGNAMNSGINPFHFSTKFRDGAIGLSYYGHRFLKPEIGRWLRRDPMGEEGGGNLCGFALNNPIDLVDLFGLITGPTKIVGLDKNWPGTQTYTYSSSMVCRWETTGKLAIVGPNNGDTVSIYPTGESTVADDSVVTAITASGNESLKVTVLRPKYLSRPSGITPKTTNKLGIYGFLMEFKWRIADQFDDPLPDVVVEERIGLMARYHVAGLFVETGSATTDSTGKVGDTHRLFFYGRAGFYCFEQTIIVGNWEAVAYNTFQANGTWSGNLRTPFN